MPDAERFRVRQFAAVAGVSIRTLHYYDRLGLLKARRASNGFRVYTTADLERLERILVLKCIGVPLRTAREVLDGGDADFRSALCAQLRALEEKKRRLESVIAAVRLAERAIRSGQTPDVRLILEAIEMEHDHTWILDHFRTEARPAVEQRLASLTPESRERFVRDWTSLGNDILRASDADPNSARAQHLLTRWEDLIHSATDGDPNIVHGLKSLYADRSRWPESARSALAPLLNDEVLEFVKRAVAARAAGHGRFAGLNSYPIS